MFKMKLNIYVTKKMTRNIAIINSEEFNYFDIDWKTVNSKVKNLRQKIFNAS